MKKRLLEILTEKSFKYSEEKIFKLVSGTYSNYYVNAKATTLDPEGMNLIGATIFDMVSDLNPDGIGGLTLGADPIALAVSMISFQKGSPIKAFVVRKNAKSHGMKKWIEGNIDTDDKVIVIDDVITTGKSTLEAVKKVRAENLSVVKVIALVDREEGGKENIEREDISVESLFTQTELRESFLSLRS